MTFREIYEDVAHRCDKSIDRPDATTQQRLNVFINDRYRQLMRLAGVIDLRDESFTFTTTAGRARYALPAAATSIVSIIDTAHRTALVQRTLAWIRQHDASSPAQIQGTPWVYAILNAAGVQQQPAVVTASALQVLGAAGDTGDVAIEYQDADGGFRVILVTLNGATPVTVAATCVQVFRMTYQKVPVGTIILREIVSGANIITLAPTALSAQTGNLHASHSWILHLWPTPAGAYTYTVDGSRPRAMLVEPMDEPAIPEDFHTLLVWGACEDEMLKMDDTRRSEYAERWKDDRKAFLAFLHQPRGQRWIRDRRNRTGWTPLGSNFPAWQ